MKYLVNVTEVYRVDTEEEVEQLIADAKADNNFSLVKYNREYKVKKSKGDIIDDWYKVSLVKSFNDEKEPERIIEVSYEG